MTFLSFDNQGKRVGKRAKVTRKRLGKSIKILKLKLAQRGNESSLTQSFTKNIRMLIKERRRFRERV